MTHHTPTPWELGLEIGNGRQAISAGDTRCAVADTTENAAFIVLACNAYDRNAALAQLVGPLVEALEGAAAFMCAKLMMPEVKLNEKEVERVMLLVKDVLLNTQQCLAIVDGESQQGGGV